VKVEYARRDNLNAHDKDQHESGHRWQEDRNRTGGKATQARQQ
jgi:hypothetical protein